ncbi:BTAD domain-containing putative transcriptional regulator [Mesobacillus sp. AQ2]|jgi:LuxR family transcriptional regulator, maltose regulon positive regulatory protein|uniref:BTAD domain-containing putative transcriptional regulator n=1 Tax=Mesobacillus sp. AQ2 TaxID=3043332 RepID=UPI0024C10D1B|nr:BTAD domain-containing putative transcriptional regulator [Mesobacillus sp. AQ2]WHX41839.1 BTAD domain-containing putative transcriptional regulator [Mesobacillus sp. AQ2]
MQGTLPLIKTKLIVPSLQEQWIRRADFSKKMKAITEKRLTVIQAGAGYGKSTALAMYVRDQNEQCCWYTITSSDDDILPFLSYLTASIQTLFPDFGFELTAYMKKMDRYIREEELSMLSSLFINETLQIPAPIIVILDDFHAIEHSYHINVWMEKLLEHMPDHLHLVISTRTKPGWKVLAKMKARNELNEISKSDLIFGKEEIELLLSDYYQMTISDEQIDQLYNITEGWVIAVGMIAQQLPHLQSLDDLLTEPAKSLEDLFQYLVHEVFSKQPPMIQQFLEQTCIFEEISSEVCDHILGMNGSVQMLQQLAAKNLFIHQVGENQFRYHALFREFLENRLLTNRPEHYHYLILNSGRYFEKNGQWEEALYCYEKAGQYNAAAAIMDEQGLELLERGKLENLQERLVKIPQENKERYCSLLFLEGEVYRYRSMYQQAERCYEKAIQTAESTGNVEWESRALEGKAKIYLDTIQPLKAERILARAIELRETAKLEGTAKETGRLYRLLAENLINSGQAVKAEKWIERARAMGVQIEDGNLEARLYLRTGRFAETRRILTDIKGVDKLHLPLSHRETDLLLALIEAFTGNGMQAKILSQSGIEHGINSKAPFVEACGWIRMGHAVQLIDQYDLEMAEKCYETALDIMGRLSIERGKAEPLMGLCILYGSRREYERSAEAGRKALLETEQVKDVWLSALITLCMSISAIYNDRFKEAAEFLRKAEELFYQCGDEYGKMLLSFWDSVQYFTLGDEEGFKTAFASFLKRMKTGGYEFFLKKKTTFGPRDLQILSPMLIQAMKLSIVPAYTEKLMEDLKIPRLNAHPGYTLRVQTLGQFRLWLGDREVEDRSWQRGKAKELFQLFLTKRNQFLMKEDIFQILWPAYEDKNADRDFKVALNALNNVLEPARKARAAPFFVIRDGTGYGINPHAAIELDSRLFEEWAETGLEEKNTEKSIEELERALHLYNGDYLPERRYEDWCINERERLLVYFLRSAEKLAQLNVRRENYDSAIHWCQKILHKDRTWEEAYRLLMFCYYRKNNRPQAIRWYRKCCDVLEEELGVTPLEPTRHMYDMIIEGTNA